MTYRQPDEMMFRPTKGKNLSNDIMHIVIWGFAYHW